MDLRASDQRDRFRSRKIQRKRAQRAQRSRRGYALVAGRLWGNTAIVGDDQLNEASGYAKGRTAISQRLFLRTAPSRFLGCGRWLSRADRRRGSLLLDLGGVRHSVRLRELSFLLRKIGDLVFSFHGYPLSKKLRQCERG